MGIKQIRKLLAASLVAALCLASLGGCGNQETAPAGSAPGGQQPGQGAASAEGNLKKLVIFSDFSATAAKNIKNYGENAVFQKMQEITGVEVEWNHPPSGQIDEQFNLLVSSGDLPDVILYKWNEVAGGPLKYVNDQVIIDLTPYMETNAPNFSGLMAQHPDAHKQIVDDNGSYYYLPMLRLDDRLRVTDGPQIRVDWLNKLGLEKPQTMEELYTVLKAMKEGDPNGIGKENVFPLTGQKFRASSGIGNAGSGNGIGNIVGAWGVTCDFYQKDGVVKFGPIQPEFREGLTFIAQMFAEGLIDPDYMLNDRTKQDAKVTGGVSGMLYAVQPANFMRTMAESGREPDFLMEGMPWPKGADGVSYALSPTYNNMAVGPCAAITTKAQFPAETLAWLDYAYGEEGNILFNLGIEGDSFHWEGDKAVYEEKVAADGNAGYGIYNMALNGWAMSQSTLYHEQLMWEYGYPAAEFWRPADRSLLLPLVSFSDEDTKRVSKLKTDIDTYVDEMLDKFTTGREPMENFDNFVETVNKMGIEELTGLYQGAYDRYMQR